MAKTKATPTYNDNPILVLKTGTCPTTSGKSTLGYEIGTDDTGDILLRIASNDGGGFFSDEWVSYEKICEAIAEWPDDQGITSMTFRKVFRGKSANTPGFLVAVLNAVGLLEPEGEKRRVHRTCDPADFLAEVSDLQIGSPKKSKAKAAPKKKAAPKTKAKAPRKATAKTAKAPRKTPTRSKKASK